MTTFEQRRCDYCHQLSPVKKAEELVRAGWTRVGGRDCCPVCAWDRGLVDAASKDTAA